MQGEQISLFNPHTVKAGEISDGYHTFDELYEHRTALFATICNMLPNLSWKSFKHDDGTMYDNCFIAGIHTPEGDYSYHCDNKYFYMFALTPEVEKAPPFDGHKPCDYDRLFGLCLTSSIYKKTHDEFENAIMHGVLTPQEMVKVCKPKKEHHSKIGGLEVVSTSLDECLNLGEALVDGIKKGEENAMKTGATKEFERYLDREFALMQGISGLAREQAKANGIDLTKADEFYGRKD